MSSSDDVMQGVQKLANDHPWVRDDGAVDAGELKFVHDALQGDKHACLRRLIRVLLHLLGKDDKEVAHLLQCEWSKPLISVVQSEVWFLCPFLV
jgi:hypothetical protein